ncbi:zinc-finger associated domain (zf-AD) domain-containing protein [Phthorimaea operculella]|nr:zinc-finger associated domain (zf-AD) domain-containing protein [Phthorimaea operculella]
MALGMANTLDFNKICRACLSDTEPLKDLFSVCSPEIFKYCTSVEISITDPLPKQVCQKCIELLDQLYFFKQVVIRSNTVLRQQCPELAKEETTIVEEPGTLNQIEQITLLEHSESLEDDLLNDQLSLPTEEERDVKPRKRRNYSRQGGGGRREKPQSKRPRMKCVKCEKSFQKYENLEAHMRSHFGKKPDIKCEHCGKTFLNFRTLNAHVRTHYGARKYQCQTCGKHFAYLNVLKNHELIHAGIKKHACHICDMKFVQAYNLKMHIETHSAQKNYGCVQCGKKFAQPGNLKIHLIRHTGVKNIACTICDMKFYVKCGKKFAQPGNLKIHLIRHTGVKNIACTICDMKFYVKCGKKFAQPGNLKIHLIRHTGVKNIACTICDMKFYVKCGKKFAQPGNLKIHLIRHTGVKNIACTICDMKFYVKGEKPEHQRAPRQESARAAVLEEDRKVLNSTIRTLTEVQVVLRMGADATSIVEKSLQRLISSYGGVMAARGELEALGPR